MFQQISEEAVLFQGELQIFKHQIDLQFTLHLGVILVFGGGVFEWK